VSDTSVFRFRQSTLIGLFDIEYWGTAFCQNIINYLSFKIWGCHSVVCKDSGCLGYDLSLGKWLLIQSGHCFCEMLGDACLVTQCHVPEGVNLRLFPGQYSTAYQKTWIFITTTVKASHLRFQRLLWSLKNIIVLLFTVKVSDRTLWDAASEILNLLSEYFIVIGLYCMSLYLSCFFFIECYVTLPLQLHCYCSQLNLIFVNGKCSVTFPCWQCTSSQLNLCYVCFQWR